MLTIGNQMFGAFSLFNIEIVMNTKQSFFEGINDHDS